MNILRISSNYPFNLSSSQKEKCGTECIAYVSPTDIKVTTCGTRIFADNVFPQKQECKIIEKVIIEHLDITSFDTIISPFFGGGSFEFYMQNKYGVMLIVNDKHTPLYNFWKQVKIDKGLLCEGLRAIDTVSVSKEQLPEAIAELMRAAYGNGATYVSVDVGVA